MEPRELEPPELLGVFLELVVAELDFGSFATLVPTRITRVTGALVMVLGQLLAILHLAVVAGLAEDNGADAVPALGVDLGSALGEGVGVLADH